MWLIDEEQFDDFRREVTSKLWTRRKEVASGGKDFVLHLIDSCLLARGWYQPGRAEAFMKHESDLFESVREAWAEVANREVGRLVRLGAKGKWNRKRRGE